LKDQARVLGIDDGPFVKGMQRTPLAGVLVCPPGYVEGVMVSSCQVDGEDANQAIIRMVRDSRFSEQVRMVMLDGAALGGFNVVYVRALSRDLGVPVLTISRDQPDMDAIRSALIAHFPDWERRFEARWRCPTAGSSSPRRASRTGRPTPWSVASPFADVCPNRSGWRIWWPPPWCAGSPGEGPERPGKHYLPSFPHFPSWPMTWCSRWPRGACGR